MNPFLWLIFLLLGLFLVIYLVAMIKRPSSRYKDKPEEKNPMEGKKVRFVENDAELQNADGMRGHLEAVGETDHKASFYERITARWRAEEDDEILALNLSKFCRLSPKSRRIVMAALNEAFRVDRENGVLEAEGEYKVTVRTTWLDKPPYGYGNYKSKQED